MSTVYSAREAFLHKRASAMAILLLVFLLVCSAVADQGVLIPDFYDESCPSAEAIVKRVMLEAVQLEPRTAAFILRLHFHDCFVNGCDGSVLLDDTPTMQGEKMALPNLNSARGFDVVDRIKFALEQECEGVVSCADALALAARDAVVLTGGQYWEVPLGRRDSLWASRSAANRNIPPPNLTLSQLVASFASKGLSAMDMVTLSGSHTIGKARCPSFSQRLGNGGDPSMDPDFLAALQQICPPEQQQSEIASFTTQDLDASTPISFDNGFYAGLLSHKGLLTSDQALFSRESDASDPMNAAISSTLVASYAYDTDAFLTAFSASMIKLSSIGPLTGNEGDIRSNCRSLNQELD